jgi:hypothetical protein
MQRHPYLALAALACGCFLFPPSGVVRAAEWHVSPTGTADGDGSAQRPWDLQTGLWGGSAATMGEGQGGKVLAGDTIWLHGGEYRGGFESTLAGTAEQPIIVRQAPGERATIDCRPRDDRDNGLLALQGAHCYYWGFEITCSDPVRVTSIAGSWPEDIHRGGISVLGSHIKLINLVVHDTGGLGAWSAGEGGDIYGCLIYHNGWKGPDRGHGHAIYAQNRQGTKRLVDNVLFNQFSYGIHCYGSEKAFLEGFHIEGNASFNNGALAHRDELTPGIMVGGGSAVKRLLVIDNYIYGGGLRCGYPWGVLNEDAVVKGNYIVGGVRIRDFPQLDVSQNTVVGTDSVISFESGASPDTSAVTWDDNTYYRTGKQYSDVQIITGDKSHGLEFEQWREATGFDRNSAYVEGEPSGVHVFVRPNQYEAGRAHVIVYNWDQAPSVRADLSAVLKPGQHYRVASAQNFYGPPLVEGDYAGEPVVIPLHPTPAVQPVGMPDYSLPATEPAFGVFVVLP